jgi:HNH endonuclease
VEIAHIIPWAKAKAHSFDNMIALCPNCHARQHRGDIDRQALRAYKANLALFFARYGDLERRLLYLFSEAAHRNAAEPQHSDLKPRHALIIDHSMEFEFMYLIADGLLESSAEVDGVTVPDGCVAYRLTSSGARLVAQLAAGKQVV